MFSEEKASDLHLHKLLININKILIIIKFVFAEENASEFHLHKLLNNIKKLLIIITYMFAEEKASELHPPASTQLTRSTTQLHMGTTLSTTPTGHTLPLVVKMHTTEHGS